MEIKALICLFAAILQQTQWQMIGGSTTATTKRSDSNNQPIHCYVCYSCNRVETSQSLPCPSDHDRCMIVHLVTGERDRLCSDERKCEEEKHKSAHEKVDCCFEDDCNGISKSMNSSILLLFIAVITTISR